MHIEPTSSQLGMLSEVPDDKPFVMLNLLRYRAEATYPDILPDGVNGSPCDGRTAYQRYAVRAISLVTAVGGSALFRGAAGALVIGPSEESWDDVLLIRYPSARAFFRMIQDPQYQSIAVHRTAALSDARLLLIWESASS
ncbi:MAG: DUF1330 domain-containing protein [Myxococcota bacterium]